MMFRIFSLILSCTISAFPQVQYLDLETVLPIGYVRDGTIDYTEVIQRCIDEESNILFPGFPILVNQNGLKLKSNSNYLFKSGSKLIMKPNDRTGYSILDCNGRENISINGPVLEGDRDNHIGTRGEWGFGISIRGAKNIQVIGAKIYDCFGDGIYIGRLNSIISDSILISNCYVFNSRRNGLSITSGTNIVIKESSFLNSNGKAPSSGVDIEPNGNFDELQNIFLEDITTENNENWGLLINLVNLRKNNTKKKTVSISVNSFRDSGSKYGLSFWLNRKNRYVGNVDGNIVFNNVTLVRSKDSPIKFYETNNNLINLSIYGIAVDEVSYDNLKSVQLRYWKDSRILFSKIEIVK